MNISFHNIRYMQQVQLGKELWTKQIFCNPTYSGPLGGDQQIGAMVATGELDLILFFRDPLTAQPHEPDVSALLRLCDVYGIPLATNIATAELLIRAVEKGYFSWREMLININKTSSNYILNIKHKIRVGIYLMNRSTY